MKRKFSLLCLALIWYASLQAQLLYFPSAWLSDSATTAKHLPVLARELLQKNKNGFSPNDRFRLQLLAADYSQGLKSISDFRLSGKAPGMGKQLYLHYELYARAAQQQQTTGAGFSITFKTLMAARFKSMDDLEMANRELDFMPELAPLKTVWEQTRAQQRKKDSLSLPDAVALCRSYITWQINRRLPDVSKEVLAAENKRRFVIRDSVLIKTEQGHTISALVVWQKTQTQPQPAALMFTIYAEQRMKQMAKIAAARGYAGVVAFARGKALSPDTVMPYENESTDVNGVIDWISRQTWCDGRVGMYGGSYNGLAQWAATKHLHPALKTIVPYVASIPGMGLPMENNIFLTANYGWAFYVTDHKYLDDAVYNDPGRWQRMNWNWFNSGRPFRQLDSIDGTPNRYFQRWLQHPTYDKYWQNMTVYGEEFSKVTIPVLSITGYYDDNEYCALHYLREHYRYNPSAEHYLVVGPFDHFGSQWIPPATLRGYAIDPVARINTPDLTFQWLDYVLKGRPKPSLLKDKINYEVMGANVWKHAASISAMHTDVLRVYLSPEKTGDYHRLVTQLPDTTAYLLQTVDMADRTTLANANYYPDPLVRRESPVDQELAFISEPFTEPVSVDGSFEALIKASVNKKDMDFGMTLYELTPKGEYFHLSYYLGRASYAHSLTERRLLKPGVVETITVNETRLVSRQLQKGSRLLLVLSLSKTPWAEINHGSGKPVSTESAADAGEPMQVKWYSGSYVNIPISK